jgi:hypothetical protein
VKPFVFSDIRSGFHIEKSNSKDFGDVQLKKSGIGQFEDGLGAFANRKSTY